MGFTPKRKVYVLDFEGTDLDGLEVRAYSTTVGRMLDMGAAMSDAGSAPELDDMESMPVEEIKTVVTRYMDSLRGVIEQFAEVLVSWNYEAVPGVATPATIDGLRTLDPGHLKMIISAWQRVVADVPAPLAEPSSGGTPSLEGSLPMEALSSSLAS